MDCSTIYPVCSAFSKTIMAIRTQPQFGLLGGGTTGMNPDTMDTSKRLGNNDVDVMQK